MEEARREGAGIKCQGEKRHPRFQNDDEDDDDNDGGRKIRGLYERIAARTWHSCAFNRFSGIS